MKKVFLTLLTILLTLSLGFSQDKKDDKKKDPLSSGTFGGLKWRAVGPALTSGRIADFAVNPKNHSEYYVAVASGHVWKTINNGTTYEPVFDNYGAYSIGCVVLDPNNENVVWVGTGENNHQRALGYGDGIYKSVDGGKSFKNMGLKNSRQIGGIVIDPRNSNVIYAAAEGSAWGPGGDRGLYKSVDGGTTWTKVLEVSENTGINNVIIDPKDPDVLYATSEQRRRHVFTKIGGGPESHVYKSNDAGKTWDKIESGLPSVDKGGMGIAISPVDHNVLYLIVEAAEGQGGFFRSTNRGASWEKMNSYASSGQYYNEIYCDPKNVDKVYSVETVTKVTKDAGKTWENVGLSGRHVDDHAMWIDPCDTKHYMIGGDGGIYESYDEGKTFIYKSNLSVTQFYRVAVDYDTPFYNIYGGTQDNNSLGGPSQTLSSDGIVNFDWFVTNGGDGFWSAIDPTNPNIVFAESQYGGMVRYDKKSGESMDIRPEPRKGEDSYKWNWDTPLFISKHNPARIYCAANKVFKSDDRGDHWEVISEDLTTKTDRNTWPVMGKFWSVDAVAKDVSTSPFGTIVSLDESPKNENLLIAGTDDGVISVTTNGGKEWSQVKTFPGVPEYTYVSDILADRFDENVMYAAFNNHKRDDFKPYLLKSTDKGKTWKSISANLPENGMVHTIAQDFKNPKLLFVGTEFSFYFSVDGGEKWIELKGGLPTIAVRDIAIQEREQDLVIATFGRGFYVLDNYSPLRDVNKDLLEKDVHIFPVKDALMFHYRGGRYGQGATYFKTPNPEFGAVITYYVKDAVKTSKQVRKEKEKELFKDGKKLPMPNYLEQRKEANEIKPHLIFTITDESGAVVRTLTSSISSGINRINWDLKYSNNARINLTGNKFDPTKTGSGSTFAIPGKYKVSISKFVDGEITEIAAPTEFTCKLLNNTTLPAKDVKELVDFQKKLAEMNRTVQGTNQFADDIIKRVEFIRQALYNTPGSDKEFIKKANKLAEELNMIDYKLNGQESKASTEENEPAQLSINQRMGNVSYIHWGSTSGITGNEKRNYEILREELPPVLNRLKEIYNKDIKELEAELDRIKAPFTPGRIPELK